MRLTFESERFNLSAKWTGKKIKGTKQCKLGCSSEAVLSLRPRLSSQIWRLVKAASASKQGERTCWEKRFPAS